MEPPSSEACDMVQVLPLPGVSDEGPDQAGDLAKAPLLLSYISIAGIKDRGLGPLHCN